jgi:hypothetical protein
MFWIPAHRSATIGKYRRVLIAALAFTPRKAHNPSIDLNVGGGSRKVKLKI